MSQANVDDLGISKNLLQMSFMRRTLLAKEKNSLDSASITRAQGLPNPDEYPFHVAPALKSHLARLSVLLQGSPVMEHDLGLFKLYDVPAGFRSSYGGFNPARQSDTGESNPSRKYNDNNTVLPSNLRSAKRRFTDSEEVVEQAKKKRHSETHLPRKSSSKSSKKHRRSLPH